MPIIEKHNFFKINTDLELRFMQPGMYRYLLNGVVNASDDDNLGSVENPVGAQFINKIGGWSEGGTGFTDSVALKIYKDKETNTLIIFLYEPIPPFATEEERPKDSIWRYTPTNDVFDKILEWDGLNFDKDFKITGVNVINGQLIFTDNLNEIRKINIENGISGLYDSIGTESTIFNFTGVGLFDGKAVFKLDSIYGDITTQFPNNSSINVNVDSGTQPSGTFVVSWTTFQDGQTRIYTNQTFVDKNSTGTVTAVYGIKEEDITLLRRGPIYPLTTTKTEDVTVEQNHLERNSFQFTYRYIYWDNEKSVVAPMSKMELIGSRDDLNTTNKNNIICTIPDSEEIGRTIKKIEWIFRVDNTNEFAIFKSTGSATRVVSFRNDIAGVTLADAEVLKSFDDVPLKAKGLKAVQNYIFLNNYTTGYDSVTVNLIANVEDIATQNFTNETLYERKIEETPFEFNPGGLPTPPIVTFERYWWKLGGNWFKVIKLVVPDGTLYYVEPNQGDGLVDAALADEIFVDASLTLWHYYYPTVALTGIDIIYLPSDLGRFFKTGDPIQLGIRYSDFLGRNIGVSTNEAARVTIPEVSNPAVDGFSAAKGTIGWSLLDNSEIPLWATHYEIMRTRNLSRSFFLQGVAGIMIFGLKTDNPDGTETLELRDTWDAAAKLYFHIQNSIKYKIGYIFSDGDRLKFNIIGTWYDAKITSQDGPWLVVDNPLTGSVGTTTQQFNVFYEIYTPYLGSLEEDFFEIGEKYVIDSPGTASRAYSVTSGQLNGDVVRKTRPIHQIIQADAKFDPIDELNVPLSETATTYTFEATNPNDDYYEQWVSDIGRSSVLIPEARQIDKKYTLKWGGQFSIDSLENNISSFSAFDEYPMPLENGPASFLGVTRNNLLYFHEGNVSSVYIKEGYVRTQDQAGSLIRTVETVGDDRKLKLEYGCVNPESLVEYEDEAWFWDVHKGSVVRYSNEGLVPISDDGMVNHFYDLSRQLLPYKDEIKVYGGFDEFLGFYYLTFEPNTNANFAGETFAFSTKRGGGGVGWFSFEPNMYGRINKTLFSYANGSLFSHTDTANCNLFYSIQYKRVLRVVGNQDGSKVKIWANFRIDAESLSVNPDSSDVVIKLTNDQGQEGRVLSHQIEKREGVFIGGFKQDVLTPNSNNIAFNGDEEKELYFMYNGDVLRSQVCEVEITNDRRDLSPLYFVSLLYRISEASFK